ncbi:putative RNA recognition motif domain, nucleotide-binding alpha-beta plait domain superfamily [Helianthus annuus]|uniref:RNA recognition motif domain, nucleotide-binding alpha-beta plait domain superfamily n=1 Tax=Helianthus annuus TaxID=4232 RepID=A0A9K3I1Q2_HELAN|nr:putative RNA recognition motif domain, nucleotide-binding alpha-beta plait domain superfamily [Helianthus annuus]
MAGRGVLTKFFVSNLPEGCPSWELRCSVEGIGNVAGTFVAKKRDKSGCIFGFISFGDVSDKHDMVNKIRGIRLGECKLKANVARFAVEKNGPPIQPESVQQISKAAGPSHSNRNFNVRDFRSYRDVVGVSSEGGGAEGGLVGGRRNSVKSIVVPDSSGAFKELNGNAVVGRTVDLETLVDFDRLMRIAKIAFSRIQYLGVLAGEANRIKEEVSLKWKNRSFRIWMEEELNDWVPDCLGVPFSPSSEGSLMMNSLPDEDDPVFGNGGSEKPREEVEEVGETQRPMVNGNVSHATGACMQEERENSGLNNVGRLPRFEEGTTVDNVVVGPNVENNEGLGPFGDFNFLVGKGDKGAQKKFAVRPNLRKSKVQTLKGSSPNDSRPKKRSRWDLEGSDSGFGFVGFTASLIDDGLGRNSSSSSEVEVVDLNQRAATESQGKKGQWSPVRLLLVLQTRFLFRRSWVLG